MNNKENTYFNVGAYSNREEIVDIQDNFREDLVALTLENAESPLEERITPYEIKFDKEGKPNFALRWENKTDFRENEALFKVRDMLLNGEKAVLWISPPSKEIGYKECRFVVFLKKEDEEEGVKSECRGLCGNFSGKECLKIANNLGSDSSNIEVLRSNPIAFKVEEGKDWIETLEEVIDIPKVWDSIRKGEDLVNKSKKEKIVKEVVAKFMPRIRNRNMSYYEELQMGAQIESFLKTRGVNLQQVGSCGVSNSEALGSFDVVFNSSLVPGLRPEGYDYYCSICGCWCKDKVCPICNESLSLVS